MQSSNLLPTTIWSSYRHITSGFVFAERSMDELRKLEHLSLVSKVCTELDNHLGMNDKDLGKSFKVGKHCKNTERKLIQVVET